MVVRIIILFLAFTCAAGAATTHRSEIRIRDPFVLPDPATQTYYIYGTTTAGIFDGRLAMVIHQPNRRVERARFFEIEDLGDTLRIKQEIGSIHSNNPNP